jgi:hypothetical protein
VGEVANTKLPDPVSLVTAAAKFAEVGVPRKVATPVPKDVIPVPPLATDNVPVVPATIGSPVAFVRVAAEGVPRLGVVSVGEVAKTREPVPVSSVTAAARFAEEGVPRKVATPVPKEDIVSLPKVMLDGFVPNSTIVPPLFLENRRLSKVFTAISAPPVLLVKSPELGAPVVSRFLTRIVAISKFHLQ